jgi:hypothetical protein
MQPLYLGRIEDLWRGDFVKVDWAVCHHVALLTPDFLLRLGFDPRAKVLDLTRCVRCRDAEPGDEPSYRSSGGARTGEPLPSCRPAPLVGGSLT